MINYIAACSWMKEMEEYDTNEKQGAKFAKLS